MFKNFVQNNKNPPTNLTQKQVTYPGSPPKITGELGIVTAVLLSVSFNLACLSTQEELRQEKLQSAVVIQSFSNDAPTGAKGSLTKMKE